MSTNQYPVPIASNAYMCERVLCATQLADSHPSPVRQPCDSVLESIPLHRRLRRRLAVTVFEFKRHLDRCFHHRPADDVVSLKRDQRLDDQLEAIALVRDDVRGTSVVGCLALDPRRTLCSAS